MFRINLLVITVLIGTTLLSQAQEAGRRPNIVFIMADDHALKAISAYNSAWANTPNIDRIGKEGVQFTEARVTNSVCSPSRAVILTGKYSHLNGMKDNGTFFDGDQVTLPKLLQEAGYKTAIVGKWHLFTEPTGFDYWSILKDQGNYYNPLFLHSEGDSVINGYVTDIITDRSLNWIAENKEHPFFMMIHHKAPHRNAMPPLKYLELYSQTIFPKPATFLEEPKDKKAMERQLVSFKEGLDIRYDSKVACDSCPVMPVNEWAPEEYQRELVRMTPEERKQWDDHYAQYNEQYRVLKTDHERLEFQYQRFMQDYLSCVASVDENVGKVLDFLDKNGLADNTIVVYLSDQGFFLGEHGLYDKRFMYEEAFRTPMLIRFPAQIRTPRVLDDYVLNLDIAPTLLDLTGAGVPGEIQGRSMKTLMLAGEDAAWRKSVYYHYYETSFGLTKHYGILKGQYKLIHFYDPIDSWEFYDLNRDPLEIHNQYEDPRYKAIITDLKVEIRKQETELLVSH